MYIYLEYAPLKSTALCDSFLKPNSFYNEKLVEEQSRYIRK